MRSVAGLKPRVESFTIMLELCAREGGKSDEALALMGELDTLGTSGAPQDLACLHAGSAVALPSPVS